MELGSPSYAYMSLTGGCPDLLYYGHSSQRDRFHPEKVYLRISNALRSGTLVIGGAGDKQVSSAN